MRNELGRSKVARILLVYFEIAIAKYEVKFENILSTLTT
jgi:hypothetical protein